VLIATCAKLVQFAYFVLGDIGGFKI